MSITTLDGLKLIKVPTPFNLNLLRFDREVRRFPANREERVLTELRPRVRNRGAAGFSYEQYSLTCFARNGISNSDCVKGFPAAVQSSGSREH
jgi:hypothetical protein